MLTKSGRHEVLCAVFCPQLEIFFVIPRFFDFDEAFGQPFLGIQGGRHDTEESSLMDSQTRGFRHYLCTGAAWLRLAQVAVPTFIITSHSSDSS